MFTDKPESYRGVYSLLLTPFKEDKSIDYDVYAQYVEWQVERGSHHLFSVCGSSEMTKLTPEERVKCATIAAKHSGSAEVVATANLEPTWHMQVEEVKRMEQTGVDGLVFVSKGYADNDERLVEYLSELAGYTTLPIILYEFPGMQPCNMSGKAYGELVKTGRFHGIKDTTCTMAGIKDKIANVRFYTVKLVNEYVKQFDSSSKEKIKTMIRDLTKDEDNDVKFYASKLLETIK